MPNRILRAEILRSEAVDQLSLEAEVFYRRIMSVVDDHGRYYANITTVWTAAFPLKADRITREQVAVWLDETVKVGLIKVYEVDGKRYLEVDKFGQQKRSDSKFPGRDKHKSSTCLSSDTQMSITQPAETCDKQMISNGAANEHLVGVGVGVEDVGVIRAYAPHPQSGSRYSHARNYEEVRDFVIQQLQLPESDAEWLWEKWQGNGWLNNGRTMSKWRETASQWERQKNIFPSQKSSGKYA